MRHHFRLALVAGLVLGTSLAARPASAQAEERSTGQFVVIPRAGLVRFADGTSLEQAGFLGFEALYNLQRWLSVGTSITVSQPTTRKEDFPAAFAYEDTTFLFLVRQPVTLFDAGLTAHGTLPTFGRVAPYILGGVGYSTLYLDPQTEGRDERIGLVSFQVGGGADLRLSNSAGIRIEARDLGFLGYDRERLNPVNPAYQAYNRFQDVLPERTPSKKDGTMHNLVLSIGFTFTPSIGGTNGEGNQ